MTIYIVGYKEEQFMTCAFVNEVSAIDWVRERKSLTSFTPYYYQMELTK